MIGQAVWDEARSWRGTPFHWSASVKGVGADCLGLVLGVARELLRPEGAILHPTYGQSRAVPVDQLKAGLTSAFDRASEPALGDVLLLRFNGKAQHLAIYGGRTVMHTYNAGPRQVIEQSFGVVCAMWPIDSIWRWR